MHSIDATRQGYYRFPSLHGDTIVFVTEDDLWQVSASGGVARRLTAGKGRASYPAHSPDGQHVAFVATEEGQAEAWVVGADGGPARRLTHFGAGDTQVVGWDGVDGSVLVGSSAGQPFARLMQVFRVGLDGGEAEALPWGYARHVDLGVADAEGRRPVVLTRHQDDLAYWKRYRGGRAGAMWVDRTGEGSFEPLLHGLGGAVARAMWVGGRVVFLSDHEGTANLYGCEPDGSGLERLTHHDRMVARYPRTDGARVVYTHAADLWMVDPATGASAKVEVDFRSPRAARQRRFPQAASTLEAAELHPDGHALLVTSRGRPFTMGVWDGGVRQHGARQGTRYRGGNYLPDGKRMVAVSDEGGEEAITVLGLEDGTSRRLEGLELGFVVQTRVAPKGERVAVTNQRCEVIIVGLGSGEARVVGQSAHGRISGMAWSPDGRWLAFALALDPHRSVIKIADAETGEVHDATSGEFRDVGPSFDPDGRYLYYISYREFDPVYDSMQFDLNFPRGMRLCLVTLREDVEDPFAPKARPVARGVEPRKEKNGKNADITISTDGTEEPSGPPKKGGDAVLIDFEGIEHRTLLFPIKEGRFGAVRGTRTHVFYTALPIEGSAGRDWRHATPPANATLRKFCFEDQESRDVLSSITSFALGQDGKALVLRLGNRLRVVPATLDGKAPKPEDKPGRKSGWVDLRRISLEVDPPQEWAQMLREAWRLMRDNFWVEDMSGSDWEEAWSRYAPLIDRVGSRTEFSDLVWELQGELGTSHAYELGGDYPHAPRHNRGFLGAELAWDALREGWAITELLRADGWHPTQGSPLGRAGTGVRVGDLIVGVDGRSASRQESVDALLVDRANKWVELDVVSAEGGERRRVSVKALADDRPIRYRAWVDANRARVHEATGGRIGYVHVPNMGPTGYAEFHRGFLAEVHRSGLVVDVRYNGGGHVSQRLIEKLARRRVGYDRPRYGAPEPYPHASVAGPLVCLTNEYAGSDGDIFSHVFKLYGLGPLIGKRTWGGVIGISPRHRLVDNSIVTQPEFSFWFEDVGWGVENWGTEPDIEVDVAPQDHALGRDPQLERAIAEATALLEANPPAEPDFGHRPMLARPPLPDAGER